MNKEEMEHFKSKLLKERSNINRLLKQMRDNDTIDRNIEVASELSLYDNHPSDSAAELDTMVRGMAYKKNEIVIIEKIDGALKNIEDGSYGTCKSCGREINQERLEFIPYAELCVDCKRKLNDYESFHSNDRPPEEDVIGPPFGLGYNDFSYYDEVGYDAEDSYQDVQRFDRRERVVETYEDDNDYVEPIEKVSNEQYKNQLPD
jgi:YteA family regulatory protein